MWRSPVRIPLPNGYALSRIDMPMAHVFPYHCEFAVVGPDGNLNYETPLTDDVVVCLSQDEEDAFLIEAFKWAKRKPRLRAKKET